MSMHSRTMTGKETLELAFSQLEDLLPDRLARALAWLHSPGAIWVRIPAGLLCIAASVFWFMPIIGIEWLPMGLLLLAQDLPFLRKPVGRLILFLIRQWHRLVDWWRRKH